MKIIFEEPKIMNGLGGNVVLFYDRFIIGNIEKDRVDLIIDKIDTQQFNSLELDLIIDVKFIQKYDFLPRLDSSISFTMITDNANPKIKIDFQNVVVAEKAEKYIENQFKQIGFKSEKTQLTSLEAAISPAKKALGIGIFGGLLTGYVYSMQSDDLQQRRVKGYVLLFRKLAESVGYLPFLIVTIVLVFICLFFVVKRMLNPPFKISVVKM